MAQDFLYTASGSVVSGGTGLDIFVQEPLFSQMVKFFTYVKTLDESSVHITTIYRCIASLATTATVLG